MRSPAFALAFAPAAAVALAAMACAHDDDRGRAGAVPTTAATVPATRVGPTTQPPTPPPRRPAHADDVRPYGGKADEDVPVQTGPRSPNGSFDPMRDAYEHGGGITGEPPTELPMEPTAPVFRADGGVR
jgi:hypothetical protein